MLGKPRCRLTPWGCSLSVPWQDDVVTPFPPPSPFLTPHDNARPVKCSLSKQPERHAQYLNSILLFASVRLVVTSVDSDMLRGLCVRTCSLLVQMNPMLWER